jgi:hypothetical protein
MFPAQFAEIVQERRQECAEDRDHHQIHEEAEPEQHRRQHAAVLEQRRDRGAGRCLFIQHEPLITRQFQRRVHSAQNVGNPPIAPILDNAVADRFRQKEEKHDRGDNRRQATDPKRALPSVVLDEIYRDRSARPGASHVSDEHPCHERRPKARRRELHRNRNGVGNQASKKQARNKSQRDEFMDRRSARQGQSQKPERGG